MVEEVTTDVVISAIFELRSRLKQSSLLWENDPQTRLWYIS